MQVGDRVRAKDDPTRQGTIKFRFDSNHFDVRWDDGEIAVHYRYELKPLTTGVTNQINETVTGPVIQVTGNYTITSDSDGNINF